MSKIIFLGDVHGEFDAANYCIKDAIEQGEVSRIIQVGDLGDGWPNGECLDRWEPEPHGIPIHWIDGNHDNHAAIAANDFNPKLIHENRGNTRNTEGLEFLFCGGAESIDRAHRIEGFSWWPEERVDKRTIDCILDLDKKIDVVVTHDRPFLSRNEDICGIYERKAFATILDHFKPQFWFYGHWHKFDSRYIDKTLVVCCPHVSWDSLFYVTFDTETLEVTLRHADRGHQWTSHS